DAGAVEGLLHRGPGLARKAAHGHRTLAAVEVVVDVLVGLQFAEVGEYLEIGPRIVAPRRPRVKILWRPANECLAIDGPGSPHHDCFVFHMASFLAYAWSQLLYGLPTCKPCPVVRSTS